MRSPSVTNPSTQARLSTRDDAGPVFFRLRPPQRVPTAELHGDMIHWFRPIRLEPVADDAFETRIRLPVGAYVYKYRTGHGQWLLDPHNPRTRCADGPQNSLLVVGGTDEPVLHAPVPPFVHLEDDGRVCLRAGLRGPDDALWVRWDEGHGRRDTLMRVVGREREHGLLEARLPASGQWVEYVFVLDDGRLVGR